MPFTLLLFLAFVSCSCSLTDRRTAGTDTGRRLSENTLPVGAADSDERQVHPHAARAGSQPGPPRCWPRGPSGRWGVHSSAVSRDAAALRPPSGPSPNCQDTLLIHSPPIGPSSPCFRCSFHPTPPSQVCVRHQDPLLWLSPTLAFPPALTRSPQPSWQGPRRGGSGRNSRAGLLALLSQMICS